MSNDNTDDFIVVPEKKTTSQIVYELAEEILEIHRFYARSEKSQIWMYDEHNGVWRPDGVEFIQQYVKRSLGEGFKSHIANEVIASIRFESYDPAVQLGQQENKIVLLNGVLNIESHTIEEFDPNLYEITQVPVKFDPDADCPHFKRFLEEILDNAADRDAIIEHLGSCLHKVPYSNIILLLGEGANGKSILLDVIKTFLGAKNVSAVQLQRLEQRFQTARLHGKLANICADLPATTIQYTGMIKMLTGGDVITAEHKNRDPFEFTNYAKLWFSANEVPPSWDGTDAFHRRMRIIEFKRQFLPDDPKTRPREELLAELTTEEELSGILNLALEGLGRLRDQGHLSGSPSIEDARREYIKRSDTIQYFAMYFIEQDADAPAVPKQEMYDMYVKLCRAINKVPKSDRWFGKKMKMLLPFISESQPREEGTRIRVWEGIRIRYDLLEKEGVEVSSGTVGTVGTVYRLASSSKVSQDNLITLLEEARKHTVPTVPTVPKSESDNNTSHTDLNSDIILTVLEDLQSAVTEVTLREEVMRLGYSREEFEHVFEEMKRSDPRLGARGKTPVYYFLKKDEGGE